jgi:hypothetical protein
MLDAVIQNANMMSKVTLKGVILAVIMLGVVALAVIMLSVVMLSVLAPSFVSVFILYRNYCCGIAGGICVSGFASKCGCW